MFPFSMSQPKRPILTMAIPVLLWVLFGMFHSCLGAEKRAAGMQDIKEIYYHIGDLHIRPNGMIETDKNDWILFDSEARKDYARHETVWFKINIPKTEGIIPWLYLITSDTDYMFFYHGHRLFADKEERHPDIRWARSCSQPLFIMLEKSATESPLYIRVQPNRFSDSNSWIDMTVGDRTVIMQRVSRSDMEGMFLSQIFIFIGLCLMAMFLIGRKEFPLFSSFGFFSICFGMYNTSLMSLLQIVLNRPTVSYYGTYFFFYLMPVGLMLFFDGLCRTYAELYRFRVFSRIILIASLIHAFLMVGLDLAGWVPVFATQKVFGLIFLATTFVLLWITLKILKKEKRDTTIIGIGSLFAALTGIHDLIFTITGTFPLGRGISNWGMFIFILSVILFMFKRFINIHRELRELNITLEERVTDRTKELENANLELNVLNEELHAALNHVKETELQLIQSEKMALLGNLVAGIAHEINSPLGSIKSNVEMEALLIESAEAKTTTCAEEILEQTSAMNRVNKLALDRIIGLVKSLKNFARLDEAELKEADLHEGIDSTLMILNNQLKTRIEIVKEYGVIPQVYCHPQQLNQVFLNILLNAIQAIDKNGRITIRTSYENGLVRISFKDTGHGIPPENLPKIFKAGFTTKDPHEGTGLGLSISQELIRKNHGQIHVKSEPGKGTEFIIELPVLES